MLARTAFPFFILQLKAISAYLFSGYVIFTIQDQQQTVVFTFDILRLLKCTDLGVCGHWQQGREGKG